MAKIYVTGIVLALGGTYLEKTQLPGLVPWLFETGSTVGGVALPRAFGLFVAILTTYSFWVVAYGMSVGGKRKSFMEKARKDGEENVDARYSLPNLYVDGHTKHSMAFNKVQRSHQNILESITHLVVSALFSSLVFPVTATFCVLLAFLARITWTSGYSDPSADPIARYRHFLASHIWSSLVALSIMSFMTATQILGLFTFW
jgi:MAPEG family